ncbi:MAG: LysR family transcriptional regulator [Eubacteriaceae bacterium]
MDIKQLRYFVKIKQEKSFTHAADSLFISRQCLSKTISNLEKELGLTLFFRTSEGVELTKNGVYFYSKVKKLLAYFDELNKEMINKGIHRVKNFKLGFTYGSFNILPIKNLEAIQHKYPDVNLSIHHFPDKQCEEKVKNGNLDMACSSGPISDPTLNSVLFKKSQVYVFMNKNHTLAKKETLTLHDFKNELFYYVSNDFRVLDEFIKKCKANNFEPIIPYTTPDTSYINEQVLKQNGISLIPQCLIKGLGNHDFVFKPFPLDNFYWSLYLIYPKNTLNSHYAQMLAKIVFSVTLSL